MADITSEVDICNLALGHLGNYGTVTDIDTPTNDKEVTFKLWYDITRKATLKKIMPNFALGRKVVAQQPLNAPVFGFEFAYEYPTDCLKLLGIGNVDEKELNYSVEANKIYSDQDYEDGAEIRYIKNITDVNSMSVEFILLFSQELASNVSMAITQDINKKKLQVQLLPGERASVSGQNAQENPPIRKSSSRFRAARFTTVSNSTNAEKK